MKKFIKKILITIILTLLSVYAYMCLGAFRGPSALPSDSDQDFPENILGADNNNNDFNSGNVAANADGSIIERLNYIKDNYNPRDYGLQKNQTRTDDSSSDGTAEEASWTPYTDSSLGGALVASGSVYRDNRTGLYWSDCYCGTSGGGTCSNRTNSFELNGALLDTDDGLDAEDSNAVNFCESLSLDSDGSGTDETDWYLPSYKELMQAYINGAGNNLIRPDNSFWSSTETDYNVDVGIYMNLYTGYLYVETQSNALKARCVRSDND